MRGLAALAVVIFHAKAFFGEAAIPGGYLAVDLFFGLSGFVLAHAYEERFAAGLPALSFMRARLIRLYPLYILGTLLGIVAAIGAATLGSAPSPFPFGAVPAAAVVLPSPFTNLVSTLYPLNPPAWSLLLELLANFAFVLCWRFLSNRALAAIVLCSGALLFAAVLSHGDMDIGANWATLLAGLPRVTFSFFLGVLLYRLRGREVAVSRLAWAIPLAMAAFFMAHAFPRAVVDLTCAFLMFPALIWLGAQVELPNVRLMALLGAVSYPIYALHYPLYLITLRMVRLTGLHWDAPLVGVVFVLTLSIGCIAVERWYDRPVRAMLDRKRRSASRVLVA